MLLVGLCYNEGMAQVQIKTRDKRYQKTEEAILAVLMKSRELPAAGNLAKRARISRSTLYRHHRTVPGIVPDYEREVLIRYTNTIRRLIRRKNTQVRMIYLRTLIFVMANRRVFEILLKYSGGAVVEKMVLRLRGKLGRAYHLPKNSDKMLRVYAKEVAGMVEEWGKDGFKESELESVLGKIMYLTETMRQRLGPLDY